MEQTGITMKPGVYYDLSAAEYFAIDAISASGLRLIGEKSPQHYRWNMDHPRPPTPAMVLGTALDCLLLSNSCFAELFEVPEPGEKSWPNATCPTCGAAPLEPCKTKKGEPAKRCCAGRRELHDPGGKTVLSWEQWQMCQGMAAALRTNPYARAMLDGTCHQVTLFWREGELEGKARLDMLASGYLADLKTCAAGDGSPERWPAHAWRLAYHYQIAWYRRGAQACGLGDLPWLWLVVESEAPYPVALHLAAESWSRLGNAACDRALQRLIECRRLDQWPGYRAEAEGYSLCSPPSWAGREVER